MKELIRHTLKEETGRQERLERLIKQTGIVNASSAVGGFDNVVKILKLNIEDIDTQEMLVKNYVYFADMRNIEVDFIEVNNRANRKLIKIYFETDSNARNIESWYSSSITDDMNDFFPFKVDISWHPVYYPHAKILIDAVIGGVVDFPEEINESEDIRPEIRRRIKNLYRLVNAILPNLYTCDYPNGETFIQGVVDELYWLYIEDDYGLQDLKFEELSDFVFNYMGDELIVYYEDRCSGMMESRKIIKKILMEEEIKKLPSFFTRRIDHHKFEKMMRKGIPYIFHDSNSLEEFKYKLVEATLENYIYYKYEINIDELPQEDKDTFIKYMIEVYDPVLTAYYRNFYKR